MSEYKEYQNSKGQFHREDGPAIIYPYDGQRWYLDNKPYTENKYYQELHRRGLITEEELFLKLIWRFNISEIRYLQHK